MEIATQMQQPKSSWYFQNKGRFNDLSVTETNTISTSELYFGIGDAFVRIIKEIDIEHKHDDKESESLLTHVALKFMSVNKTTDSQSVNESFQMKIAPMLTLENREFYVASKRL